MTPAHKGELPTVPEFPRVLPEGKQTLSLGVIIVE